jgi:hypothetical protein
VIYGIFLKVLLKIIRVEYAKFYRKKGDWKTANRIFE